MAASGAGRAVLLERVSARETLSQVSIQRTNEHQQAHARESQLTNPVALVYFGILLFGTEDELLACFVRRRRRPRPRTEAKRGKSTIALAAADSTRLI
jgi:hypothetical protein